MADHNTSFASENRSSKKKKRNQMSITKKYGKQGQFGRGGELKEPEYNFFMTLSENMKNADGRDKVALVRSFFDQFTAEDGQRLACNQIISRMLDTLLPQASVTSLQQIISVLSQDLWLMCTDPFGSHVLQTVLVMCLRLIQEDYKPFFVDDDDEESNDVIAEEDKEKLLEFIIKMSKYCYNNLQDFITERYASHIIRTLLEVQSGVQLSASSKGGKHATNTHTLKENDKQTLVAPQQLEQMLLKTADRLKMVPDLPEVVSSECGSAVFQAALQVLSSKHRTTACQPLADHLLTHGLAQLLHDQYQEEQHDEQQDQPAVHPVFNTFATTRLLEVVIESVDCSALDAIYSSYFEGRVTSLVQHPVANFAVQRLLTAWQDQNTFERVSEAVLEAVPAALAAGHTGVLLALAKACGRLNSQQGKCCVAVMKALDCHEPVERESAVSPVLVYLTPFSEYQRCSLAAMPKVSLHGALLLQEFLRFKKPIKFVKSLLQMETVHLSQLLQDPRGSHISDVFCSSLHVGEKSRLALAAKMQDEAVNLACSKHGSRSLEVLWSAAAATTRATMCQKLADSAARIKGNCFGAILYSKFNVRLFSKANKDDWAEVEQKKADKRRKLKTMLQEFDQAPAGSEPPAKKKKRKQSDQRAMDDLKGLLDE